MATNPDAQMAKMLSNLQTNTGRTIHQWTDAVRKHGLAKHGEAIQWLKAEHGMTHGYANLVAHHAFKSDASALAAAGTDLVAAMFAGDKAALRPIYDALVSAARGFGDDVEEAPKKGYLSLRRSTQFATLHPSTKTRFDVGLKLKGVQPAGRLEPAGSWNSMVTHRVRLASLDDVDPEMLGWLKQAYTAA